MIAASYKPKKKFMQLAIAEAKRARDRGDYAIGAVITRVTDGREVVIASAGNRGKSEDNGGKTTMGTFSTSDALFGGLILRMRPRLTRMRKTPA
jgi:hypothetical protein